MIHLHDFIEAAGLFIDLAALILIFMGIDLLHFFAIDGVALTRIIVIAHGVGRRTGSFQHEDE